MPKWNKLYNETANDNPFDVFVKRFKKLNGSKDGATYEAFINDIRKTFKSFTEITIDPDENKIKSENLEEQLN